MKPVFASSTIIQDQPPARRHIAAPGLGLGLVLGLAVMGADGAAATGLRDVDEQPAAAATPRAAGTSDTKRLLEPQWNEPNLDRARKAAGSGPRAAGEGGNVTLPRLGFGQQIVTPSREDAARSVAPASASSAAAVKWPACAAALIETVPYQRDDGTAYTDTYNFGCIEISVSGDRNIGADVPVAATANGRSDCEPSERAAASEPVPPHPGDDTGSSFSIEIVRFGIPYSIEGTCLSPEADVLCRSRALQCALVDRLIFKGGNQQ